MRALELKTPIPLAVEPTYGLLMLYFAWMFYDGKVGSSLNAVGCATFSVLMHELGHAYAAKRFGGSPKITLELWGGKTHRGEGPEPSFKQKLAFIAAGPAVSLILALLAFALPHNEVTITLFAMNAVWTVLNLVPILPLDGGQLLQTVYLRLFPSRTMRDGHLLSAPFALLGAAVAALFHDWELSFLGLFILYTNVRTWQNLKYFSEDELKPELQSLLRKAQAHEKAQEYQQAYDLMLTLRPRLGPRNTAAIAIMAMRLKRYEEALAIVDELRPKHPKDWSLAFLAARCHAGLGNVAEAERWFKESLAKGLPKPAKTLEQADELKTLEPLRKLVKA